MKFMFMIYHDEQVLDSLPDGEMQQLVDAILHLGAGPLPVADVRHVVAVLADVVVMLVQLVAQVLANVRRACA